MNRETRCFDAVSTVVDTASKEFAPRFKLNTKAFDILRQYCSVIDEFAEKISAESIDVHINERTKEVEIRLTSDDLTMYKNDWRFFELIKRAVYIRFKTVCNSEKLRTIIRFPSVWRG